jgi:hypothetical protein
MNITLRDLYILLECGKYVLRIQNQGTGFKTEIINEIVDKVINELNNIKTNVDSK